MVTYTTNKKLNKPAYGEYPNSWNVPVNEDWDIIDKALGGVATFTVSSTDITLSISEAQNQRILLQGTPGATRNIIIPFVFGSSTVAVGGMWIVDNQTNANQNIITEVSGSQGVTVTLGRRAIVYSNGTNVYFADDVRLISGNGISVSGSTVSLASPVTVSNGGTGRTTLTSGNVLIGDGTNNVSFVAPGTAGNVLTSDGSTWTSAPASGGSGTGITSINFSTTSGMGLTLLPASVTTSGQTVNLSGTLSIANGGTGATTISSGIVKSNGSILSSGSVALGSEVSGTLPITNGGTGVTSFSSGIVKYNGATLQGGGTVALGTEVSGTLGIGNGGTGTTSLAAGIIKSIGVALSSGTVNLASATDIGTSILGVANGGTGISSATANKAVYVNATGNGYLTGTLPVVAGGTGIAAFGTGVADALGLNASGTTGGFLRTNGTFSGTFSSGVLSGTITGGATFSGSLTFSSTATFSNTGTSISTSGGITVPNAKAIKFGNGSIESSGTAGAIYLNSTTTLIYGDSSSLIGYVGSASPVAVWLGSTTTFTVGNGITPQAYGTTTFTNISDARIKKNVETYNLGLDAVSQLSPVKYQFNGAYGVTDDGKTFVGLIAQDVQKTSLNSMVNDWVHKDPLTGDNVDLLSLNTSELIFALVNSVKELKARVEALEAKVGP